jgi:hypothetical protein
MISFLINFFEVTSEFLLFSDCCCCKDVDVYITSLGWGTDVTRLRKEYGQSVNLYNFVNSETLSQKDLMDKILPFDVLVGSHDLEGVMGFRRYGLEIEKDGWHIETMWKSSGEVLEWIG